jgi:hypothetical protein
MIGSVLRILTVALVQCYDAAIRGAGQDLLVVVRTVLAAAVAVARKLAVLIWHMLTKGEDYAWGRPLLMARKLRNLELAAGPAAKPGKRGSAYEYGIPERRQADRAQAEQAERAYTPRLVRPQVGQYMDLLWSEGGPSMVADMLEAAQLLHLNETSRAVVRSLRSVGSDNDDVLAGRFQLLDRIRTLDAQLLAELQAEEPAAGQVAHLRRAAAQAEDDLAALDLALRRDAPELLSCLAPEPLNLVQVQRYLCEGEALWLHAAFDDANYVLLVTREAAEVERAPIAAERIDDLVREVRSSVDLRGRDELGAFAVEAAAELFYPILRSAGSDGGDRAATGHARSGHAGGLAGHACRGEKGWRPAAKR